MRQRSRGSGARGPFASTFGRSILDDADAAAVRATLAIPSRGHPVAAGGTRLGVPGVSLSSQGTFTAVANTKYYEPFIVLDPTTVDALFCEVTGTGGTIARLAIATADAAYQPIATVLEGTVATTGAAVVNTTPSATVLAPGRYVKTLVCDGTAQFRTASGSIAVGEVNPSLGANALINRRSKAAVGTGAGDLTAWDTASNATGGQTHMVFLRLTAV